MLLYSNALGGSVGAFGTTCRRLPPCLLGEVTEVTETEVLSESWPRASYLTVRVVDAGVG